MIATVPEGEGTTILMSKTQKQVVGYGSTVWNLKMQFFDALQIVSEFFYALIVYILLPSNSFFMFMSMMRLETYQFCFWLGPVHTGHGYR